MFKDVHRHDGIERFASSQFDSVNRQHLKAFRCSDCGRQRVDFKSMAIVVTNERSQETAGAAPEIKQAGTSRQSPQNIERGTFGWKVAGNLPLSKIHEAIVLVWRGFLWRGVGADLERGHG